MVDGIQDCQLLAELSWDILIPWMPVAAADDLLPHVVL